jgi:hypothetical protein
VQAPPAITEARAKSPQVIPWLAFSVLAGSTLALFLIPAIIIQPFRFQSARALALAVAVRQQAPYWTVLTAAGALLAALLLWRRIPRWNKAVIVAGLGFTAAAAVMTRVDYFEWMFHPVAVAGFESAGASRVDPSEMVMAVNFNGDARAYPVFEMAYHHVLNDVVGGVPIAVTY